jgi:hypothetical protein
VTGLSCVARTFADLARLEQALPEGSRTTAHGKVVVGKGDHQRDVVVVFLARSVSSELKIVGALNNPRVEALTWTSDRDVLCLYDRPLHSGNNGQVERAVCASLAKRAGKGTEIVGTARAMGVIGDILKGSLKRLDEGTPAGADRAMKTRRI